MKAQWWLLAGIVPEGTIKAAWTLQRVVEFGRAIALLSVRQLLLNCERANSTRIRISLSSVTRTVISLTGHLVWLRQRYVAVCIS